MINGKLPDYPEPPPRPKRDIFQGIKKDLAKDMDEGGTEKELEELQFLIGAVEDHLNEGDV